MEYSRIMAGLALFGWSFTLAAADNSNYRVAPWQSAPPGNTGLFIGVDEFSDDPELPPLKYAADDAVEQAHLFVEELRVIQASNCWVAIAGEPNGARQLRQWDDLKRDGVHIGDPKRNKVLKYLRQVATQPSAPDEMVVVSFSSHGFDSGQKGYAMLSDSLNGMPDSALSLDTVREILTDRHCHAGKRLLLIDCCRANSQQGDGSKGATGMSDTFLQAFRDAKGLMVLNSCDVNQSSFEQEQLGHGVFTYFLLEAIRGEAPTNKDGLITLGAVATYVAEKVKDHVYRTLDAYQEPSISGTLDANSIPLSIGPHGVSQVYQPSIETNNSSIDIPTRFIKKDEYTVEDHQLNKTWIIVAKYLPFKEAQRLADNRGARLPTVEELKSLCISDTQALEDGTEVYLDTEVFHGIKLPRCWSRDRLLKRKYFDFSDKTDHFAPSIEESESVILIKDH